MMHAGKRSRGNRMESRGHWRARCWRAAGSAALLLSLAAPQLPSTHPLVAAAAPAPGTARPELSTYAGQPAAGDPKKVAQQPFGLAVFGRYTFVADPINHVVRLLINNGEVTFAGAGGLAVEGDGADPVKAQLAGPYAVAIGQVTQVGYDVTSFDIYIADTFGHQIRKVHVTVPPLGSPGAAQTAVISTIAGAGAFGFGGDNAAATAAQLNSPYGVAWDKSLNRVYFADTLNNCVRSVSFNADGSPGNITTAVGPCSPPGSSVKAPLNHPRGLASDGNGKLYIADTYNNVVRVYDAGTEYTPAHPASLSVVAGTGAGDYRDGVAATSAFLKVPSGVALGERGDLFIADTFNNAIRTFHTVASNPNTLKKDADKVSTLVGSLAEPMGAALDARRNLLYVSDTFNNVVRAIDLTRNTTTVVAGTGRATFDGDGQSATQESLNYPTGLAVDSAGNLFIADTYNSRIREVVGGKMYTVAGTGTLGFSGERVAATSADLYFPYGVTVGTSGAATLPDLYITDSFNHRIRKVAAVSPTDRSASNLISTVAGIADDGFGDGSVGQAQLSRPWSAGVDQGGIVYVADYLNHRLRRVDPVAGTVTTIAGKGNAGLLGDVGPADAAELDGPHGLNLLGDSGAMLVADSFNNRVRWFGLPQAGIERTQVNFGMTNVAGQSQL